MSAKHRAESDDSAEDSASDIAILSGDPTLAELAAIAAVIGGMTEELAEASAHRQAPVRSAWETSQRPLRTALTPGYGAWRGFTG